jgi:hypothetical protein
MKMMVMMMMMMMTINEFYPYLNENGNGWNESLSMNK